MVIELRAPDPTLVAYDEGVIVRYHGRPYRQPGELPVAHRGKVGELTSIEPDVWAVCGASDANMLMEANEAAYIAIPCRECFPDAPPPGNILGDLGGRFNDGHYEYPFLSWQINDE